MTTFPRTVPQDPGLHHTRAPMTALLSSPQRETRPEAQLPAELCMDNGAGRGAVRRLVPWLPSRYSNTEHESPHFKTSWAELTSDKSTIHTRAKGTDSNEIREANGSEPERAWEWQDLWARSAPTPPPRSSPSAGLEACGITEDSSSPFKDTPVPRVRVTNPDRQKTPAISTL